MSAIIPPESAGGGVTPHAISGTQAGVGVGAIVDLRPTSGHFRQVSISTDPPASAGFDIGCLYDGTTAYYNYSDYGSVQSGFGNSTIGISYRNGTGGGRTLAYTGADWY